MQQGIRGSTCSVVTTPWCQEARMQCGAKRLACSSEKSANVDTNNQGRVNNRRHSYAANTASDEKGLKIRVLTGRLEGSVGF